MQSLNFLGTSQLRARKGAQSGRCSRLCSRAAGKGFGAPRPAPQKPFKQVNKQDIAKDAKAVLQGKLGGCSVVFLGDNTALNEAAAHGFASMAGYIPLNTSALIQEVSSKSVAELEAEEGRDAVVIAEVSTIEQLAVMIRCSIGTLGGGWGGTARIGTWRHLYGAFTVWIDTSPDADEASAPQRGAYSEADVHVKISDSLEDVAMDDVVDGVLSQAVPAILDIVKRDEKLTQGKMLYIKLGCRGDWPTIMPPEWQPDESPPVNA